MDKKTLLLLLTLSCVCCSYSFSQNSDSSGIYVMNVEFNLMTMVQVKCEGFANRFPTMMQQRHTANKDSMAILDSFLKKVKYQKRNREIDVRGQVYYIKPGHAPVTICMNDYYIMVNGRLTKENEKFIAFLKSMTL